MRGQDGWWLVYLAQGGHEIPAAIPFDRAVIRNEALSPMIRLDRDAFLVRGFTSDPARVLDWVEGQTTPAGVYPGTPGGHYGIVICSPYDKDPEEQRRRRLFWSLQTLKKFPLPWVVKMPCGASKTFDHIMQLQKDLTCSCGDPRHYFLKHLYR
jgi:hypothetical protein